jgi:hypothetical protein
MRDLAVELKIPKNHAIGIMEHFWNWTAEQCPRGNVGRVSDEFIQEEVAPELRRADLVAALIKVGFLDRHDSPEIRLYVHDWHEHADNSLRKRLERNGITTFATGVPVRGEEGRPKTSHTGSQKLPENFPHGKPETSFTRARPEPEPEPEPEPPPSPMPWERKFHQALLGTGKLPNLTYEALRQYMLEFPAAGLEESWREVVTDAVAMTGIIGSPPSWLRAEFSRMEVRALKRQGAGRLCGENGSARRWAEEG